MESRTYAIVVGFFTFLLGCGLIFSFWWINGAHQALNYFTVVSKQPVTGLIAESVVKFRGVVVGKVVGISLDPNDKSTIYVNVRVPQSLQLTKGSYAELRAQGVTGLAYIDINDTSTTEPLLNDGDKIMLQASMMDKLFDKGPALVEQIEALLKSSNDAISTTNQFIKNINSDALNKSLSNVERASTKIEPLLDSATVTLNRMSGMASEKNQAQLAQTLASVQKTADNFQPLLIELDATAKEYRSLANEATKSSHQLVDTLNYETLPQMHTLTQNVNKDVRNLGHVIEMLEDNPQSLIFGSPAVRPGPGEAGFKSNP